MVDVGLIVATINLLVAVYILSVVLRIANELRGAKLFTAGVFLSLTGIMFVMHAGVEIIGLSEQIYAITALITTVFFAGAVWNMVRSTLE